MLLVLSVGTSVWMLLDDWQISKKRIRTLDENFWVALSYVAPLHCHYTTTTRF